MSEIESLREEIERIKERNKRVEADKAWETSWIRRIAIALLTYFVVCLFFLTIGVDQPYLSAIVPVIGFLLSTFSLELVKSWWLKRHRASS